MLLANLDGIHRQRQKFAAAETAPDEHRQNGVVPSSPQCGDVRPFQQELALGGSEPVAHADAKTPDSFDSAYSRSQLRAQQSRVARLISHAAYRRQTQIDGVWSVPFLLQVNPVSQDHRAIEGQARLGAIPLDEVVDGMVVRSLPAHGCEGIEDSGFGLFEIGQCTPLWRRERVE